MALRRTDFNLFAVFAALERERSVTRAAEALGLSQPAVSHALERLRYMYEDKLFARGPSGMEPTPRAREIAAVIGEAVGQLQATLERDLFDPATCDDRMTLAMDNYATIVLAARLAQKVLERAPRLRLVIRPSGTLDVAGLMRRGLLDLAVGLVNGGADRDHLILSDRHVVVMRRAHPAATGTLDLCAFASAEHLKISSIGGDDAFVDQALVSRGLSRAVRLEAPYIATAALIVGSDLIGVVPRGIAVALCRDTGLVWCDLPVEAPPVEVGMTWPSLTTRKPSHRWLRDTLATLAAENGELSSAEHMSDPMRSLPTRR